MVSIFQHGRTSLFVSKEKESCATEKNNEKQHSARAIEQLLFCISPDPSFGSQVPVSVIAIMRSHNLQLSRGAEMQGWSRLLATVSDL